MTTSREGTFGEPSELGAMLLEVLIRSEVDDIDRPHIVVCRSFPDGALSFFGPFSTGLEALTMAQQEHESEAESGGNGLSFSVAPLYGACDT